MIVEDSPLELYQRAKKDKHHYNISTQAFQANKREFVVYNISLKKDYSQEYDFINFRRGHTYYEQIIDFKHTQLKVARKGLRKFKDLMPEYLSIRQSHINKNKYHSGQKNRLFKQFQAKEYKQYVIYNTEKANGQNAQISVIQDKIWVIGSKNKCILIQNQQQLQNIKNKHQYKQIFLITKSWFSLLINKTPQQIAKLKLQLTTKTLIGQYCNTKNMQHIIDYGENPQLFFYALVQKNDLNNDCLPLSATLKFLDVFQLPKIKCQIVEAKSYTQTIEYLRIILKKMNEISMKEGGQGSVIYVSGIDNEGQHILLISKLKTIQYRIFRKLRQKLKIYIQKFNKNYQNLLKKFNKQIAQIARQFQLNKPLDHYSQIAKKAFILCEDQSKQVSKFIGNRFIHFLGLLQKNISKQKFTQLVNSKQFQSLQIQQQQRINQKEQQIKQDNKQQNIEENVIQYKNTIKKCIILIPITIPASGKTSLLELVNHYKPNYKLWSISSDECRSQIMNQMKKKMKNYDKKQAFQKSTDKANKLFYQKMGQVIRDISMSKQNNHIFFIDKNHPQSALKPCLKNIQQKLAPFKNINCVKLCLLPQCKKRLYQKGLYGYPFSTAYMLTCLKRVLNRPQHLTLQGSQEQRCNIVIGFCNLFRNFSLRPFNLGKYFNQKLQLKLNNQQSLEEDQNIQQMINLFKQILLKGKPGKFDQPHPKLQQLIIKIKKWQIKENNRDQAAKQLLLNIQNLFTNFENIKFQKQQNIQ